MKEWNKPIVLAQFTKDDIFVNDVLADHVNYNNTYNQVYNQTTGN